MTAKKKAVAALIVSLGLTALLIYSAHVIIRDSFRDEYELFRSVKVGMTEDEVVRLLGPPHRVYTAANAPADYYVEGYNRKERPITNKVLIYVASEPIAYVYFDHENKVEDVYVGGS
ncbi:MAG: outer membrane protein assembly factor BamE domain-containing protein [Candidatus Acidiferrales bacterium]